jgi:hypothetical protein
MARMATRMQHAARPASCGAFACCLWPALLPLSHPAPSPKAHHGSKPVAGRPNAHGDRAAAPDAARADLRRGVHAGGGHPLRQPGRAGAGKVRGAGSCCGGFGCGCGCDCGCCSCSCAWELHGQSKAALHTLPPPPLGPVPSRATCSELPSIALQLRLLACAWRPPPPRADARPPRLLRPQVEGHPPRAPQAGGGDAARAGQRAPGRGLRGADGAGGRGGGAELCCCCSLALLAAAAPAGLAGAGGWRCWALCTVAVLLGALFQLARLCGCLPERQGARFPGASGSLPLTPRPNPRHQPVQSLPWLTTENFHMAMRESRVALQLRGAADTSGRGLCFSYRWGTRGAWAASALPLPLPPPQCLACTSTST